MAQRSGGRKARVARRAAPLTTEQKPVRPGEIGGHFKPLKDDGMAAISENIFRILEQVGFGDATPHCIEACTAVGAIFGNDGRLRMPRAVVERAIGLAEKHLVLHGQNPAHDVRISGQKVHFATAGAAVMIADPENNLYRDSLAQDLFDMARIAETCEHIHIFQRTCVLRDIADNYEMDLNTIYASCQGTTKHIGTSFTDPDYMPGVFEMLYEIAGSEDAYRARPFLSNSNCFVVPPMKFATESCKIMEACIRGGMPVLLLSAGQAGATAPASIAGAIVQAVAECLAGLVYVNAMAPGHPAIFGTWPFVSDLRTGAMSGGSGEQALLSAGCAQMHNFYGLPGGSAAGIADAKMPDMQAGYEQAHSNVMAGLAGLNMCYESVGMHASLLGFCLESLIIGDDMLGQSQRCVRGIEVTEDSLSLETIRSVCLDGPGHYLGSGQTLELMQRDYVYPRLGDRSSPKEWVELGKPNLLAKATAHKNDILSKPSNAQLDQALDGKLRSRFNIHLKP
jgi:trimethylamine--corrinoid protein Co-methyltransferase